MVWDENSREKSRICFYCNFHLVPQIAKQMARVMNPQYCIHNHTPHYILMLLHRCLDPTQVLDIVGVAKYARELHISWKPPLSPNGIVTHYYVFWRAQSLDPREFDKRNYCDYSKCCTVIDLTATEWINEFIKIFIVTNYSNEGKEWRVRELNEDGGWVWLMTF